MPPSPVSTDTRRRRAALLLALLGLAWGGPPASAADDPDEEARRRRTGRDALLVLGEEALARGELDKAGERFARVLAARPDSVRARVGAGRVAWARGDLVAARAQLEQALTLDPGAGSALLALAELEQEEGRAAQARALLERALREDFAQPAVHERLAELTGRAPPEAPADLDAALARAGAHPYDPRALRDAGAALADAGRGADAVPFLEKALWLADRDPGAARDAARRLPELDPAWRERRVVAVRVFVDESVRDDRGWRYRVRLLWLQASRSLDPILATRFVVVEQRPVRTGSGPLALDPWIAQFRASTLAAPDGIVAAFTERPPPAAGPRRAGLAELLGRHLVVRLAPGENASRVLAHELLHVYGGIHVSPELDALMNPSGESRRVDAGNQAIARATRSRGFSGRGLGEDVLARVDRAAAVAAYEEALAVNLLFREAGIAQAVRTRDASRALAAREASRAKALDRHLADVATVVARFLLADGRRAEAMLLLDSAARFHGGSAAGRRARAEADALAAALAAEHGAPGR